MRRLVIAVMGISTLFGCSKKEASGRDSESEAEPSPKEKSKSKPKASGSEARPRKAGEMPFDFASGPTTAKAGDYVLVPSKEWIDEAFAKGGEQQSFTYYAATMIEPGPVESKVKSLSGTELVAPNGFVIALRAGQQARVGDVVLTWWQSGSGMQRSIVVGGSPQEPKVLHLDIALDNPSGAAKKEDTLRRNSFHKLGSTLEPGATLACRDGTSRKHWIATAVSADKVLAIGFVGRMKVFPKSECTALPAHGSFSRGQSVSVPWLDAYYGAKVESVDEGAGRVFARFAAGGQDKLVGFGISDVAAALPGS